MKKYLLTISVILSLIFIVSCGQKTGSGKDRTNNTKTKSERTFDLSMIKIKKNEKLILNKPDVFIQLFVLYNYEQSTWQVEISTKTNSVDDLENYIKLKKDNFFKSFGITIKEFDDYSINNMKAINEFLEKNLDYKKLFNDSLKYLEKSDVNS